MKDNKTLIYWLDATGPSDFDEIVRLTIIDTNNKVLFNHLFNPKLVSYWVPELNGIDPDDLADEPAFDDFKDEIQEIFNSADKLVTFYAHTEYLKEQGVKIPTSIPIDDLADAFRVMGDATDTIENLCDYYGYTQLPKYILDRTGIGNAKAVNYCYHEMERYRRAQAKNKN